MIFLTLWAIGVPISFYIFCGYEKFRSESSGKAFDMITTLFSSIFWPFVWIAMLVMLVFMLLGEKK